MESNRPGSEVECEFQLGTFNKAADTMTPTWINVLCFWMVPVPMAYVLAIEIDIGPVRVFWSVFTADMMSCVVGVLVFRRGKSKISML